MRGFPVPGRRLIVVLLIPLFFFILSIFYPQYRSAGHLSNLLIMIVSLAELILLYMNNRVDIETKGDINFNIGTKGVVEIELNYTGRIPLNFLGGVDLPKGWELSSEPVEIELLKESSYSFTIKPFRRGLFKIARLHYKLNTPVRLFTLYSRRSVDINLSVFPDFTGVKEYMKLNRKNRLFEMGIHKNRYKGIGTELNSLKEYNRDDDSKFIDWKASSRINRPVTKQFQMESQNDIVIVLDCGRMMCSEQNGLSTLDHGINGVLTLSHVASTIGDSVRIIAFSDKIHGDLKPVKGGDRIKKITRFLTPLQPRFVESNYDLIFSYLRKSIGKRSFVIFISDIMDDINYNMFKGNFLYLSKSHQILFLLLRDSVINNEAFKDVREGDIYTIAASRSLYLKRSNTLDRLKHSGINLLDVLPKDISGKLIDRYMEVKSRNLI